MARAHTFAVCLAHHGESSVRSHRLWNRRRRSPILSGYRISFSSLFDRFNRRPRATSALRLCLLLLVVCRDEANIEPVLTNARGRGEGGGG